MYPENSFVMGMIASATRRSLSMRTTRIGLTLVILLLLSLMPLILSAESTSTTPDVSEAWIREAPPNAMALGGYMTIDNKAPQERHLLAVSSADFKSIELHRSQLVKGVAQMIPQHSMPVPAEGRLVLKPGDFHLMMMHPRRALREDDEVAATLRFDNDELISVTFRVKKAEGGGHEHHHHHH